ncbi:MAG: hypothetical protein QG628_78 [Patescibacteria group bacterium]|nr:hypothetical protein [Patescibacteria group bacterium]
MHIIDHTRHDSRRKPKRNSKSKFRLFIIASSVLLLSYSSFMTYRFVRPVPAIQPVIKNMNQVVEPVQIAWPSYGQASVGEKDAGLLASSPNQTPRPTASVAKVMTALAVLRQKPLKPGETGPTITLTSADVDLYNQYIAKDGSVVKVVAGEKITQYQALQAMLLPSANNIADSLSSWAFGSSREYVNYANSLAMSLGMKKTTISDASGYSPLTVSTASDLVVLARAALREPVLAEIVAQPTASIPVHGEVRNVNWLLGSSGVNGIKTGNTDEAGGCFMVSTVRTLGTGEKKTLIAVILGAPTRNKAINDSLPLISSTESNFVPVTVARKGQVVGYYSVPWSGNVRSVVKDDVIISHWRGTPLRPKTELVDAVVPSVKGTKVGTITVKDQMQKSDITLADEIPAPPNSWRFQRAYQL